MSGVQVQGRIDVSPHTVLSILDREAQLAVKDATRLLKGAVATTAPEGPTGRLKKAHRQQVRKTKFGYQGTLRRQPEAWYGRIVERGRAAGTGRTGRPVGAMAANPFVEQAGRQVEMLAERRLEQGGTRAADRIQARL